MTRSSLLAYFNQASSEAIGFVTRSLQWPSLSSFATRTSESPKSSSQAMPPDEALTKNIGACEARGSSLVNRVLQQTTTSSVSNANRSPAGTILGTSSSVAVPPVLIAHEESMEAPKLSMEVVKLIFPTMLASAYVASSSERSYPSAQAGNITGSGNSNPSVPIAVPTTPETEDQDAAEKASKTDDAPDGTVDVPRNEEFDQTVAGLSSLSLVTNAQAGNGEVNELLTEGELASSDKPAAVEALASNAGETKVVEAKALEETAPEQQEIENSQDGASAQRDISITDEEESALGKEPQRCTHCTKHINLAKCSSALKKKSCVVDANSLFCLQCGKPWSDNQAAETHSSRSNHPIMLDCKDGSLICFKCGKVDVSESLAAQTEPVLSETASIRGLLKLKVLPTASSENRKSESRGSNVIDLSALVVPSSSTSLVATDNQPSISAAAPQGLKNLGNTCFFNSSIQVLAQSQHVQEALRDNSNLGPLAQALGRCLQDVARSGGGNSASLVDRGKKRNTSNVAGGVVSPAGLFSAVCKVAPHFSGFEQQDAQELITFLLGGIEDEASSKDQKPDKSAHTESGKRESGLEMVRNNVKRISNADWKMKHVEFWFGDKVFDANDVERTAVDEDAEPNVPPGFILMMDEGEQSETDDFLKEEEQKKAHASDEEDSVWLKQEEKEGEAKTNHEDDCKVGSTRKIKNLTKEVFEVELESVVVCDDCDAQTVRKETQYMLSLALAGSSSSSGASTSSNVTSVKGGKKGKEKGDGGGKKSKHHGPGASEASTVSGQDESLASCFERFFGPERLLVADGNGFQCNKCATRKGQKAEKSDPHDATRRLRLSSLNDVLVIHFKRFQQVDRGAKGVRAVKIETHVKLEDDLHFAAHGDYRLVGVVEHLGKSLHGGHYVAYVRTAPSTWFRCSDDVVSKVSENQVFDSVQAYIAVYERR